MGQPPDINRVPEAFWDRVKKETEEEAMTLLLLIFLASADQHAALAFAGDAGRAQQATTSLRQSGEEWARKQATSLTSRYVTNSQRMLGLSGKRWEDIVGRGEIITRSDVLNRVTGIFGPSRAASMAVTETTGAVSAGGELVFSATVGFQENDTWFTAADQRVCPICQPLHDTKRSTWARFFPSGPPAHAQCRCWIEYAVEKNAPQPAGVG